MSYYHDAIAQATKDDGSESRRSQHLAATIAHLRGMASLEDIMIEDDGVRVLVHVGQSRGVPAKAWLAEVDPP